MINNTLIDLNNFLFGQMERLDNPEMNDTEMESEIKRTKAMVSTATAIVNNAAAILKAQQISSDGGYVSKNAPLSKLIGASLDND